MDGTMIAEGNTFFLRKRVEVDREALSLTHCHDKYEIIYVAEGEGKFIVEGIEYPIKPRTLMVFAPLSYHCVCIDSGSAFERYVIHFDKDVVLSEAKAAFESLNDLARVAGAFYAPEAVSNQVIAIFERLEGYGSLPEHERTVFTRFAVSELIMHLSLSYSELYLRDDGELGARVIKYLNQNMDRDIPLDTLAKRFFVSKYYLCRAFKKHNGISVHGYINRKRIMYAKQLIEAGETASMAAYRVGFGDYSAFYRAYVKIVGKSPTQSKEVKVDE
ncbi:MAG: helix-turn-helix domain-containing protein [Clostridia bacterium]|nr:helix-turn-helix domain-containing protein [Clostridia bacterium]